MYAPVPACCHPVEPLASDDSPCLPAHRPARTHGLLPRWAQVPSARAASEQDWDYAAALTATSLVSLGALPHARPTLMTLQGLASGLQPSSIAELSWPAQVQCTSNFAHATNASTLNDYLHPVDSVLVLPSGEALLLSEREADAVLLRMWRASRRRGPFSSPASGPMLVPLCYARQAALAQTPVGRQQAVVPLASSAHQVPGKGVAPAVLSQRLASPSLVATQLFNGETGYGGSNSSGGGGGGGAGGSQAGGNGSGGAAGVQAGGPLMRALRAMVAGRKGAAEALVRMRGKGALFDRSDLELACE